MKDCSRWASVQFLVVAALAIVGSLLVSLKPSGAVLAATAGAILVGVIAWVLFVFYRIARNIIWLVRTRGDQETRPANGRRPL